MGLWAHTHKKNQIYRIICSALALLGIVNKISRGETICLAPVAVRRDTWMVQTPSEYIWSGAGDGFVAVSATSGGSTATLPSEFDWKYSCKCSIWLAFCDAINKRRLTDDVTTTALKRTVFELGHWTDRRTEGSQHCLIPLTRRRSGQSIITRQIYKHTT